MSQPLYRRVMGDSFERLPEQVRALHDLRRRTVWVGRADVLRGKSPICRWIATLLALPPEGSGQPLRVTFEPVAGREIWTRDFGTAAFESVQFEHHGALCERLGPTTFVFELVAAPTGLKLALRGMRLLGIPLPKRLHPFVDTLEYEQDGRYRFEVESRLPLVGLLVRYAGWLTRAEPPSA